MYLNRGPGLYTGEDGAEELPLELAKHSAEDRLTENGGL
jgi:hypothetical protein